MARKKRLPGLIRGHLLQVTKRRSVVGRGYHIDRVAAVYVPVSDVRDNNGNLEGWRSDLSESDMCSTRYVGI